MPEERGPLITRSTYLRIQEHLDRVWKQPRTCPICESNNWHVQPGPIVNLGEELNMVTPRPIFQPSHYAVPTIQAVCRTCGLFHSFAAEIILGDVF